MAEYLEVMNGVTGYPRLLAHVLERGRPREVRGFKTLDAGVTVTVIHTVNESLPLGVGRNVSRAIAAAEALQLVGGFSAPELLPASFDRFREDDGTFWGAYGVRSAGQVAAALAKIRADPGTRQAVITLWDPDRDNVPGRRDYPCTVALSLERDGDSLNLVSIMRSQDVWLGTPYDLFQFQQLLHTAATSLELRPGWHTHMTLSTHLYDRNVADALRLVDDWKPQAPADREWQPRGIGVPGQPWDVIAQRASMLRAHVVDGFPLPDDVTESELWYVKHLEVRRDV